VENLTNQVNMLNVKFLLFFLRKYIIIYLKVKPKYFSIILFLVTEHRTDNFTHLDMNVKLSIFYKNKIYYLLIYITC